MAVGMVGVLGALIILGALDVVRRRDNRSPLDAALARLGADDPSFLGQRLNALASVVVALLLIAVIVGAGSAFALIVASIVVLLVTVAILLFTWRKRRRPQQRSHTIERL
jgi:ABC-type transport system involved in cytochrome bd biosynthesis fused ATPase/permease subunit